MEVKNDIWAAQQFEQVKMPDKRLYRRLQLLASRMVEDPSSSIPRQHKAWKDIKGAYRFYDSERIKFSDIIQPHVELTKKMVSAKKVILAIQDTTFISFANHPSVNGLTDTGGPSRREKGIVLHTALAVDPSQQHPEVIGILDQQIIHRSKLQDKNETYAQRMSRWRESKKWEEASQRIGLPQGNTKIVEVMDREADVFDVMLNCQRLEHDFIIRAFHNRMLENVEATKLFDFVKTFPPSGVVEVEVAKKPGQKPRKAILDVSFSEIKIEGPKKRNNEIFTCNVIYVVERNPPTNQEALEWLLLTSLEAISFEDACKIITWYKYRWLIEEYHKCIKTGCNVEKKQFKESLRIENFLGIANVIAVRLLQLKGFARNSPNRPAKEIIEPLKLRILLKYTGTEDKDITVKEYYHLVAKIGGFIGRRSDGNPGWQTLWKGEVKLSLMVEGAKMVIGEKCG